jgi:ribose 5-phosphate isomerase B
MSAERVVAVAADHGGAELLAELLSRLPGLAPGWRAIEVGAPTDPEDDYPDAARSVGLAIMGGEAERGLLLCSSGVGVSVAANKIRGIRAAVVHEPRWASQGVEDDDLNVLCMGGAAIPPEAAAAVLSAFLEATFSGAERHRRRAAKVEALERGE